MAEIGDQNQADKRYRISELIRKNRSYRAFRQSSRVDLQVLRELTDLARLSPSAMNKQPLKYALVSDSAAAAAVYPCLAWAGYLSDFDGPEEGKRPAAYIIVLGDTAIRKEFGIDPGIAAQSILLGAAERGLGGCMIGSLQKGRLRDSLQIPETLEILLVIALGVPAETVQLDDAEPGGSIRYWRDEQAVHHVPKRRREEIIIQEF